MRDFYCNGKFVAQAAGIPVASDSGHFLVVPDFVCDAIADIQMYEGAALKFSWQGTGLNQDGEFETWMIKNPKKLRPIFQPLITV